MKWFLGAAIAAVAPLVASASAVPPAITSTYTTHDYPSCRAAASPEEGIVEVRVCAGYAGIPVTWSADADGAGIAFGRAGLVGEGLGEDFAVVGKTVEWRGPAGRNGVEPFAAIVRIESTRGVGGPVRRRVLVVHKLDGPRSCIAVVVDAGLGAANARARAAADRRAPAFRCGKDAPERIGL